MLIRSHTASHTPADDDLNDDFNTNDWIFEANDSQALDDLAVPISSVSATITHANIA